MLTAQQLPKLNAEKPNSIVDPLVRIEIHGVTSDCARKETNYVLNNGGGPAGAGWAGDSRERERCRAGLAWRRRALNCQACALGFNPRWGQTLQFQLRAPELALVRFVVDDYDTTSPNDFVGQFTLPLNSLKQGWWIDGGGKGWGSGPPRPCSLCYPAPPRASPQPGPASGEAVCTLHTWPCRLVSREADAWSPSLQGTATSTCFLRTGPRCHQPRSLSTSASRAPDDTADPPWGSAGASPPPVAEALSCSGAEG